MEKICAIVAEFNPFHNGHAYIISEAKKLTDCDGMLCIMSGSFTQRGEIAAADKFDRARCAVLGGADCVLELPVAFSVAPAEAFASGAEKILSSLPAVKYLAFGCESGDKESFYAAARLALKEEKNIQNSAKSGLERGESYIKSYLAAFESVGGDGKFLSSPNNVLGLEYTKAILRSGADIEIVPVKRIGAGYSETELRKGFSSAAAIRKSPLSPLAQSCVPEFARVCLRDVTAEMQRFKDMARLCLLKSVPAELSRIYGCTEGLENRLKSLERLTYDEIADACASKRYTRSRITRILCANLLGMYADDCKNYLAEDLYTRPLAVRHDSLDGVMAALSDGSYPTVTRGADIAVLSPAAARSFAADRLAYDIRNLIFSLQSSESYFLKV